MNEVAFRLQPSTLRPQRAADIKSAMLTLGTSICACGTRAGVTLFARVAPTLKEAPTIATNPRQNNVPRTLK